MKILVAVPSSMSFGSQNTNGLCLAAREISKSLHDQYGVEVSVIGQFTDTEDWYTPIPVDLSSRQHQVRLFREVIAECEKNKYDLVHFHANFYMTSSCGRVVAPKINCPLVVTMHSPFIEGMTTNLVRNSIKESLDAIHLNYPGSIVHPAMMNYYKNDFDTDSIKYDVISNIPEGYNYYGEEKENIVAVISRIDFMKNPVYTLWKAIKDARETGYKVVFVGNTDILVENKQSLRMRDETLKLINDNADIVEHHNKMSRAEIEVLLNRAKILYQFSTYENQALVPIEANSAGCVAVGLKEVIPHVDGPVNFLPSKLDKTRGDTNYIKLAENIDPSDVRKFFEDNFDRTKITTDWFNYYQKVLG